LYTSANVKVTIVAADAFNYTMISSHSSGDTTYSIVGPGRGIAY
jgi:hypothetical protein